MNIALLSNPYDGLQYTLNLKTEAFTFFHTKVEVSGSFGRIGFFKIDLPGCTIWIADFHTIEPVIINGIVSNPVYELYLDIPESFFGDKPEETPVSHSIRLSFAGNHSFPLPISQSKCLIIHYTDEYFNDKGFNVNGNVRDIFRSDIEENPIKLNAAAISAIKQIVQATPASRIVQLYLEAKVKELVTLLYQIKHPLVPSINLSKVEVEKLEQVKSIIANDLSKSYTSLELSRLTGTNSFKLKKNFKDWFGIPLHHFLHNCRMEKAANLLVTTQLSIKEIAFAVGYKNVSNFSESFKNYYGHAPSALREHR